MKYYKYHALNFLRQNKGAVAVSFAFMLPCLVGFYSLVFDGARFNSERSRLVDALNQSVYAVAITDNRNATADDKTANVAKVESFISYYLPDKTVDKDLIEVSAKLNTDSKGDLSSVDYSVNADQITHPLFKPSNSSEVAGFAANITLRGNGLSGIVRRTTKTHRLATDYVFVVDFSSMASDNHKTLMKEVINTLGKKILEQGDGSTIGFVPYTAAVPVRLDRTNYVTVNKEIGCTYIAKMQDDYESLNWDFWYNKPGGKTVTSGITYDSYIAKVDATMNTYFNNYITVGNGYGSYSAAGLNWLISKGYCTKESGALICDPDEKSNIHNPANTDEFIKNLYNFLRLTAFELDPDYYSMLNIKTVDIHGTLSGDYLFKDSNVRTWIIPLTNPALNFSCSPDTAIADFNPQSVAEALKVTTKPSYYLLDLSTDKSILDEFNAMVPNGGTDNSLWGLLRSVPLVAKGINERKVILVISYGLNANNRPQLRDEMMAAGLCDVIRDGLKKYPQSGYLTTSSSIYFISLVEDDPKEPVAQQWADKCVGQDNAYIATNLEALTSVIGSVMSQNNITYINPDDAD